MQKYWVLGLWLHSCSSFLVHCKKYSVYSDKKIIGVSARKSAWRLYSYKAQEGKEKWTYKELSILVSLTWVSNDVACGLPQTLF